MDGDLSLDTRLLSDAVIELNISRHNVSIYPRNHPIVDRSLRKAYELFERLFEFTPEVTLSVAKDALIVDEQVLDKKHPVYREFALSLSNLNIASVSFRAGLTLDELYKFHKLLIEDARAASPSEIREKIDECGFSHIKIDLIDYSAFGMTDGEKGGSEGRKVSLWEKYIYGLLHDGLETGADSSGLKEIPPEALAAVVNKFEPSQIDSGSYDKVISSYVRKSAEMAFTTRELRKILGFIDNLKPELKRQFLSSAIHNISQDIESARKALRGMKVDEVIHLLELANDQMLVIPDALKNIMEKFAIISTEREMLPRVGSSIIDDDIIFSEEITSLLSEANFKQYVSETYRKEIISIIDYNAATGEREALKEYEHQWNEEYLEGVFHQILLDLISPERRELLTDDDRRHFMELLVKKADSLLETGRFVEVTQTILSLKRLAEQDTEAGTTGMLEVFHSPPFLSKVAESIRLMGRQVREGAYILCDYYGRDLTPYLIRSLIDEESQSVRRFLITLIVRLGRAALPEVTANLDDDRWFVKRNMLFILSELVETDALDDTSLKKVRRLCRHPNLKVSTEAIKCLLKAGDEAARRTLIENLESEDEETVHKAISIAGSFRVREAVPTLLQMLTKKAIKGADLEQKIPVIKALGRIGDTRALPALRGMLTMKSFLYKGKVEKLRTEAAEALQQIEKNSAKEGRLAVGAR